MAKDYWMMSSDEMEEQIEKELDFYNRTRRMVPDYIDYEKYAVTYNEDIKKSSKIPTEVLRKIEKEEEEFYEALEEFEEKARQLTLKEKQAVEQTGRSCKAWKFLKDSPSPDYFIAVKEDDPMEKIRVKRIQ